MTDEAVDKMLKFVLGLLCGVWLYRMFLGFAADCLRDRRLGWLFLGRASRNADRTETSDKAGGPFRKV